MSAQIDPLDVAALEARLEAASASLAHEQATIFDLEQSGGLAPITTNYTADFFKGIAWGTAGGLATLVGLLVLFFLGISVGGSGFD